MTAPRQQGEIIEVLDCDLDVRPKGAPGIDALLPQVRGVSRVHGALIIEFDDGAREMLPAFVEAERLCCAGIGWEIERSPTLRLRISANADQLAAIESLWNNRAT